MGSRELVMKAGPRISGRGGSPEAQRKRADETRRSLVEAGRTLFGTKGFHASGTPEIVTAAAVTRGALYHHFASKEGLFEAVFRRALVELNAQARGSVDHLAGDTWAQFVGALQAYLRLLATRKDLRRIILVDGPPLLGWARWHALQAEWMQAGVTATLDKLHKEGALGNFSPEPLAILIQGAVNDAALAIGHAPQPAVAMEGLSEALLGLLEGLKRTQDRYPVLT